MKNPIIPILPTSLAMLSVILLMSLGFWQLDRKAEKEARLLQFEQRKVSEPYSLSELLNLVESVQDYPVEVTGDLMFDKLFYIDNKIQNGKVGYEVLAPLNTNFGILLLNFGWVESLGIRERLPEVNIEAKPSFKGAASIPNINVMVTETNLEATDFPILLQQIDTTLIERYLGFSTLDFVINLEPEELSGFTRSWEPVVMLPEKHLGYAVQWFGLAIACLTVYLLSLIKLNSQTKS